MNWKQFKNWLDKNVIESKELTVKIRLEKQNEYSELSTATLTNFCDSLEATLDNNASYHLFPTFNSSEEFDKIFNFDSHYFGKKTNQEKVNKSDYELLEKLFNEWKSTLSVDTDNNNKIDTRNILLIGRTGSGKSTLANVLMGENKFTESAKSVSATKHVEEGVFEVELDKEGKEKIRYRVIDTIGLGDTKMKPQGVLMRLAEMADWVKKEGLNQILFVNKGRFTKEEIEAYDLLSSIIFDKDVLKYTTVVRTGFPEFEDKEACDDDRGSLRMENAELAHILGAVNIIYVNNPPLKGRAAETNREIREESRKRVLTYLGSCQKTYRPSNIDTLDERIIDYKTHEEKLKEKMKELEQARKQQEEEFRKKLADLKEEQTKELRENRRKFEEDIHKVKVESEESLRKTKNELEDKRKRDMEEQDRKNKEREREAEARHDQKIKNVEEMTEKQKKEFQEQMKQSREEADKLRKDLNEKDNSANAELIAQMKQARIDDQKREERQAKERLEFERKKEEQAQKFERERLAAIADSDRKAQERHDQLRKDEREREERDRREAREREERERQAEERYRQEEAKRDKERHQDELKRQELERKKAKMEAAWKKWEEDKKTFLWEQDNQWFGRDRDWKRKMPKQPSGNLDDY